jgi:hypothetical protein
VKRGRVFYSQDVVSNEGPLTRLQDKDRSTPIDGFFIDLPEGPDDDELAGSFLLPKLLLMIVIKLPATD